MTRDGIGVGARVAAARLVKRDARGAVFEVVDMSDRAPARVVLRRPGLAPAESYADLPEGPPLAGPVDDDQARRAPAAGVGAGPAGGNRTRR